MALQEQPYWIIVNRKKGKIWKMPYQSREAAEIELAEQMRSLPPGQTGANWKIEKQTSVVRTKETHIDKDKDFAEFK